MFSETKMPICRKLKISAVQILKLTVFYVSLWLAISVAHADIYEVKGLGVDATAKDAQQAKIAALKSGQEAAFNILVKRLAVVEDASKLPQFTNAETASLLAGLTIEEEKTSSTRYIAKLTVRFRAQQVKELLKQFNIPFADAQAPKILLVALWEKAPEPILWDNPNPWREAWSKVDASNSITPILLPLGDLTDISLITAQDVIAGSQTKLDQLKKRYGADHTLVAKAKPSEDGTQINVEVRGESPMGQVEFIQTYPIENGNLAGATFKAARDFLSALEVRWKQENQNQSSRGGQIFAVTIPFSSLQEWQALRQTIVATNGVGAVDIKSLSARGALVDVRFAGDAGALAIELATHGLILTNVGNGWVLERR